MAQKLKTTKSPFAKNGKPIPSVKPTKKETFTTEQPKKSNVTNKHARVQLARRMAELYQGREDCRLMQPCDDASPHSQSADTAISANDIASLHLTGATGLGVYPGLDDGSCIFAVIDLDNKPERPNPEIRVQVKNICKELRKNGLDHRVCTSQSGRGYHIAIYFAEFVPAWLVRNVLTAICRTAKVPSVEVFPKQDELSPGQVGNAVRLPLFRESRFVDPRNDWKELDALECLWSVKLINREELDEIAKQLQVGKRKRRELITRVMAAF
jgi:hypothetical protein